VIRAARPVLISALAYLVVTAVMGRRVLGAVGSAVASDAGDPLLNAAILAWNATNVPWTDAWYQFPIFHPTPNALVFSEHLLGGSLLATPLFWLTDNALAAYNLTLLLSYPLCGLAMYALAWTLTRSAPAAFLAGLAYAFAPYRASQLPHVQMLLGFWAPLALVGLHRFIGVAGPPSADAGAGPALRDDRDAGRPSADAGAGPALPRDDRSPRTGRVRWLLLFAASWLLQGASNGYLLVFLTVLVALWVLWFLVAQGRWRETAWVAGAGALAALPLVPILYRYLTAQRALGLERNLEEIASFGADIAAPLCAPPSLTFWGWLRVACRPEGELFAGVALMALCCGGALAGYAAAMPSAAAPVGERDPSAIRVYALRASVAVAVVYLGIALSVALGGAWRIEAGWFRASASSADKPMTVAFVSMLVALALSPRVHRIVQRGSTATFYLLAAFGCWVLSWGPFPRLLGAEALYQAPFAWLLQLPGVGSLRVPARFWMLTVLCLAVFMAVIVSRALQGRSRGAVALVLGAITCGLVADGWMTIPTAAVAPLTPDAGQLRGRTVVVLPLGDPARDVAAVYGGVTSGWRLVNGFSGYEPVYYEALRTLSQESDDALLAALEALGPLDVVDTTSGVRYTAVGGTSPFVAATTRGQRVDIRQVDASCAPEGAALAIDGVVATAWVCGTQMQDHQFTADLGQVGDVGSLAYALGSSGAFFPRQLVIETSLDGSVWTPAWAGSPAAAVARAALQAPRQTRAVLAFPARAARYVRLRQTGRHPINYWAIAELEIWGS
jgi:hypothetical protein